MNSLKDALIVTDKTRLIERGAIAIAVITISVLVGRLLIRSNLGYDFSDEGFYLNWISNPGNFPKSLTQFGNIYHPLYDLVGGSVSSLRRANILVSYGLALVSCLCLLRRLPPDTRRLSRQPFFAIGISLVSASSSLLILVFAGAHWLPTPSYNSLVFQSLLLTSIGLCLAETDRFPSSLAGWLLIGIGGFLAFMAKPPSAVVLGITTIACLAIMQKLKVRMIALSVAVFVILTAAYAWLASGSISQLVADMDRSLENSAALGMAPALRLDYFYLAADEIVLLSLITAATVALTLASLSKSTAIRIAYVTALFSLAMFTLLLSLELVVIEFQPRIFQGLQFLAVPLAAIICLTILRWSGHRSPVSRRHIGLALFFMTLPVAYVIGTGNNYWTSGSSTAFFLTLSSFSLVAAGGRSLRPFSIFIPLSIVSLGITIVIVEHGIAHPYRENGPLLTNTAPVQIGDSHVLLVTKDSAAYIDAIRHLARGAGFQTGMPMIDLTGHYPGSLFVLSAKPVGAPWLLGGYPGSNDVVQKNLDLVSCQELARSWILTEPEGPVRLSPDLLLKYDIDLSRDFEAVGTLEAPTGTYPTAFRQYLLKPKRAFPEADSACEKKRTAVR